MNHHKNLILNIVLGAFGEVRLDDNQFNILVVKAVIFDKQHDEPSHVMDWNKYVQLVKSAIGVETYCEWVYNKHNEMEGVLAFYDIYGYEIKTKHFDECRWEQIYKLLSK